MHNETNLQTIRNMAKRSFILLLPLIICCVAAHAVTASFMPIISFYNSLDYKFGMQNWACTQDANGTMFFGNTNGILQFDGYNWQKSMLPSKGIVRSLLADGNRIYAGGYTEFGFFERDGKGGMLFHSLWKKQFNKRNDEIWNIVNDGKGNIWFQSFSSIFKYDGKTVTPYYNKERLPLWTFSVDGKMFTQIINGSLCQIDNGLFTVFAERSQLANDDAVGMHLLPQGNILIATSKNGLFVKNMSKKKGANKNMSEKPLPLHTDIDVQIKHDIVNRTIMLSTNTLVLGTIKGGVFAVDITTGRCLWHYDKHNGLGNNTVLALYASQQGNVWVALDNGIALIHAGTPLSEAGMDGIGMVYGITKKGSNLYIATNQAVWQYNLLTNNAKQISGCDGQNWYVENIYNKLVVGNNLKTQAINDNGAVTQLSTPIMGSTVIREYEMFGQKAVIEATYARFRLYHESNGNLIYAGEISGFNAPVREFEIDSHGTIWASHMSKGLYRLELSHDMKTFTSVTYYPSIKKGVEELFHVMNIVGRVVFSCDNKLYTYDDIRKRIVPYTGFEVADNGGIVSSSYVDKNTFWLLNNDGYWLMHTANGKITPHTFIPNTMFGHECNVYGKSMFCDDGYTYFFLNDGIGRYDMSRQLPKQPTFPVLIASVKTKDQRNNIHLLPCSDNEKVKVNGNITVRVSYPNFNGNKLLFHYSLTGSGKTLEETSCVPEISYSNMSYGSHTLTVTVTDISGNVLGKTSYAFTNPTPFYISIWAWLLYAAVLYAVVYYYIKWRTTRIVAHNRKMAERELMQQKMKTLEQERIIAEQQKVILENELSVKGKDMASLAFDMATMKSSMENARESLIEGMRNGSISSRNANKILQQMKADNNDMFWATYRNNFDLIHKRFFRTLHEKYPDLTSNDLRLCALLRLNLNTKEIASFTRLSVRGVEGARYRLRKKLGIPTDKSLTDFLIEIE